jgi:hypothetical protein
MAREKRREEKELDKMMKKANKLKEEREREVEKLRAKREA